MTDQMPATLQSYINNSSPISEQHRISMVDAAKDDNINVNGDNLDGDNTTDNEHVRTHVVYIIHAYQSIHPRVMRDMTL